MGGCFFKEAFMPALMINLNRVYAGGEIVSEENSFSGHTICFCTSDKFKSRPAITYLFDLLPVFPIYQL